MPTAGRLGDTLRDVEAHPSLARASSLRRSSAGPICMLLCRACRAMVNTVRTTCTGLAAQSPVACVLGPVHHFSACHY